jgi:hypothetical protein
MADDEAPDDQAPNKFASLLRRLVRVPKAEIDEREREYQDSKGTQTPVKAGEMVRPPVPPADT